MDNRKIPVDCPGANMSKDLNNPSFVLVDAEIAWGVQFALVEAGLGKLQTDSHFEKRDLRRGAKRRQQALEFLLLYGRVSIPQRILEIDLLPGSSEYVEVLPDDTDYWKDPAWEEWLTEYFRQITKDTTRDSHDEHYQESPLDISVFKAFKKADIDRLLGMQGMLLPYLRTRPSVLVAPVKKWKFERIIGILKGESSSAEFWEEIGRREERNKFAWELKLGAARMFEELKMLDWLLTKSSELGVPVATPRVKVASHSPASMTASENYQRAFRIYLQEVATFPLLRSIQDVEALRSKKEIGTFRTRLQEWAAAIQRGESNAEERLRKEIRAANEGLRHLGKMRKVEWWTTILSLPVAIDELLLQLPGFGTVTLAAVGEATLFKSNKEREAEKWLILGN
jgi:hypothetical protein